MRERLELLREVVETAISGTDRAVPAQQRDVPHVGAVRHVEHVADDRHRADEGVDGRVGRHPRDGPAGGAEAARLEQDVARDQAADDVADHRHEAEQRVDPDADLAPGDPHRAVEHACQRVEQAARQWRRLLRAREDEALSVDPGAVGLLLALAYPDRIAQQRTPNEARYLLANGRGARLPEWELRLRQPLLVAAMTDAGKTGEGMIYLAATLRHEDLEKHFAAQIRTEDEVRWDDAQQAVLAQRTERLGALVLDGKPVQNADSELLRSAMLEGLRRLGLGALPWTDEAREFQKRVLCMRQWFADESWPDLSDSGLADTLSDWLGPYLDGVTRRSHLARLEVLAMLKAQLEWKQAQQLDQDAPTHLEVPSGSRLKLEYVPGESPVLAVKLQEMFGLADTPRIARGRVPVTLHLLSPARRPIQVTQDLKGFWERTYSEVKKELKGRYPKHPWPDDPWNAVPTARAKRRT